MDWEALNGKCKAAHLDKKGVVIGFARAQFGVRS